MENRLGIEDYSNAISIYLRLSDEYPTYQEIPQHLFQAGSLSEKKLNDITKAIEIYEKIINKYPADKFANLSRQRINKLTK